MALIANRHRNKDREPTPYRAKDFLPSEHRQHKEMTWEQQVVALKKIFGKNIIDKTKSNN